MVENQSRFQLKFFWNYKNLNNLSRNWLRSLSLITCTGYRDCSSLRVRTQHTYIVCHKLPISTLAFFIAKYRLLKKIDQQFEVYVAWDLLLHFANRLDPNIARIFIVLKFVNLFHHLFKPSIITVSKEFRTKSQVKQKIIQLPYLVLKKPLKICRMLNFFYSSKINHHSCPLKWRLNVTFNITTSW